MYAKNCTIADLENAAGLRWKLNRCEYTSTKQNRIIFTLRHFDSSNSKEFEGMKRTPHWNGSPGRRTNSLCIHAHYRFFERLFDIAPDAIIESSWHGKIVHTRSTLHENYEYMRYRTVRMIDGLLADDCCNCPEEVKP